MIKLNFNVDGKFHVGIRRLSKLLGITEADDGVAVTAEQGERIGVSLKGGSAVIYYREDHHFFRELSVLCENIAKGEFDITEDGFFTELSAMIDSSRCAVPTVESIEAMIDRLALMGYSTAMLYTEDLLTLEDYKYFGYMRGRYSDDEIREIDDYAYAYGIEVMPCLECYGHMEKYLMWREAAPIKDTATVMLAREEKTFEFLEALIKKASSLYRSRRVHIGMDEANDMGRGKFLDKHGYMPPIEIFTEYMERLCAITKKYGLTPMMWNDMYFRASDDRGRYWGEDIVVSDDVKARIPEGIEQVMWHYGEEPFCDGYMLKKTSELCDKVIFAGATWSWIGHFPEHNYMMETNKFSIGACRENNVRSVMETLWFNDNAECPFIANYFGLSYVAELVYRIDPTEAELRSRFKTCTCGNYDAFYEMSMYHDNFREDAFDKSKPYSHRFKGKPLFWQDILEGLYDTHLFECPMSSHYAEYAERMKGYKDGIYDELYGFAADVFAYLAAKCEVAELLVPAYRENKREVLLDLAKNKLPAIIKLTNAIHKSHKALWMGSNKVFGWSNLDIRYAGVAARCETAIERISAYLSGELDSIPELSEERLFKPVGGFLHYSQIATVNLKI